MSDSPKIPGALLADLAAVWPLLTEGDRQRKLTLAITYTPNAGTGWALDLHAEGEERKA